MANDPSNLRARALQSVFPGLTVPGVRPTSPAPTPNHLTAAGRAAQTVAAHLAANPVKISAPVKSQDFYKSQVFPRTPPKPPQTNLPNPTPPPVPAVPAMTPQIGVPAATFPARNQILNTIFPR